MPQSLLPQLVRLLLRPVPDAVMQRARLHLLDWLGCAVQGSASLGEVLSASLREPAAAPPGPCRALMQDGRDGVHWLAALQVNAGLGNVGEMDDVHRESILHPGPVVIPVALAMAQTLQRPLGDALVGMVRGYEAAIRIGRALGTGHYAHFHNTATAGTPAAAASAAAMLGLSEEQTLWAVSNACSRTGGLWQMRRESVLTKQWHCIAAAVEGSLAAWLAHGGVSGARSVLEGEQGLFAAMAPDAQPQRLLGDESDWLIEQTSFKPWPACRHAHASIDALRLLRGQIPPGDDVRAVRIFTYADALKFCDNPEPQTALQAKFSLQHCAALVLADSAIEEGDFAAQMLSRPDLAARRALVSLHEDAELSAAYPAHFGSRVEVESQSAGLLTAAVRDCWGDPEMPMSERDLRAKSQRLMRSGGLDDAQIDAIHDWVLNAVPEAPIGVLP